VTVYQLLMKMDVATETLNEAASDASNGTASSDDAADSAAETLRGLGISLAGVVGELRNLRLMVEEVMDVSAASGKHVRVRPSVSADLARLYKAHSGTHSALQEVVDELGEALDLVVKKRRVTKSNGDDAEKAHGVRLERHDQRGWVCRVTKTHASKLRAAAAAHGVSIVATRRGDVLFTTDEVASAARAEKRCFDAYTNGASDIVSECSRVASTFSAPLKRLAAMLADLDAIQALATAAVEFEWTRPTILSSNDGSVLTFRNLRHAVVERALMDDGGSYIASDVDLGSPADGAPADAVRRNRCWLITGPNMGGKSTLVRAAAVAAVLAHVGSFVPADAGARLTVLDRVMARVGACDDARAGESTFQREMRETAQLAWSRVVLESLEQEQQLGRLKNDRAMRQMRGAGELGVLCGRTLPPRASGARCSLEIGISQSSRAVRLSELLHCLTITFRSAARRLGRSSASTRLAAGLLPATGLPSPRRFVNTSPRKQKR